MIYKLLLMYISLKMIELFNLPLIKPTSLLLTFILFTAKPINL